MRLWHWALLPYLPDAQLRGQLRELTAIMHDWRDRGQTNHLLINRAMEYGKAELCFYFELYANIYSNRFGKKISDTIREDFEAFGWPPKPRYGFPYQGWHDRGYLRICMANLWEKRHYARGKSRITDKEWARLLRGYKEITGENWEI